ncbi:MAG: RNA-splicing ligase RtcB, partial [Methylobacteriaceae bacterium]|nr:RNA-splicing ligase RtcB [Methylobacteriaceae bacterium]
MNITGKTLIALGYQPGKWFPQAIAAARLLPEAATEAELRAAIDRFAAPPVVSLRAPGALAHRVNVAPETAEEVENIAAVEAHMRELMRVPTIVAGAVMPDACPAGAAPGTIPVGGVAAAKEAIHPGMHSADICCSMAVSIFGDAEPSKILDAGMQLS